MKIGATAASVHGGTAGAAAAIDASGGPEVAQPPRHRVDYDLEAHRQPPQEGCRHRLRCPPVAPRKGLPACVRALQS